MSIFCVADPHIGRDELALNSHKTPVLGASYGLPFLQIILEHADQNNSDLLMAGDAVMWSQDAIKQAARYRLYKKLLAEFDAHAVEANGNHDLNFTTLRFLETRGTRIENRPGLPNTDILVLEPKARIEAEDILFSYDDEELKRALAAATQPNLLIMSHWPVFGRSDQDVAFQRSILSGRDAIADIIMQQHHRWQSVLTISGHEHAYSKFVIDNITAIVLPSLVQTTNNDDDTDPAGIFGHITENKTGALDIGFHQIILGRSPRLYGHPVSVDIDPITEETLEKYARCVLYRHAMEQYQATQASSHTTHACPPP